MNQKNSRLLKAIFATALACLVVFAIALSVFGPQGFWWTKTEVTIPQSTTSTGVITIPVTMNNTGANLTGSVVLTGVVACTLEYMPVCGKDNKTYSNSCLARLAGVVIAEQGECRETESSIVESQNTGSVVLPPKKDEVRICTAEYAPICGVDNKTYSNTCMAGNVPMAHIGECATIEQKFFDTGSYQIYTNVGIGYSFAMPKYAYYASAGARDGAIHTMAIATTSSGVTDFSMAPVQVWFYRNIPVNPPSETSVKIENGIIYIKNNDETGNAKIEKIVEVIQESAR